MEKLIDELKVKVVDILELVDVGPEDIVTDDPLVSSDLGIDSIDLLEMVIMIEKDYDVVINNKEVGETVFQTLRTLAEHIWNNSPRFSS